MMAASFEPTRIRAGYTQDPLTGETLTTFYFPCCACGQDDVDLVGALVDEKLVTMITVRDGEGGGTPSYYCEPCWGKHIVPRFAAPPAGGHEVGSMGSLA